MISTQSNSHLSFFYLGADQKQQEDVGKSKEVAKRKELVSFGELRSALMMNNIPRLPQIKSNVELDSEKPGWKKFTTGINT